MIPVSRSGSLIRFSPTTTALVVGLFCGLAAPAAIRPDSARAQGPDTLSPASTTAAVTGTKDIVLNLSSRTISLRDNGVVVGTWPVAIGDPASPTPTGRYAVLNKVVNPRYQSTKSGKLNPRVGPESPLGDRWMGFHASGNNQYGIHGTPNAWAWAVTSRAAVTHGCVRMLRPHVHQLFNQVEVGTPVIVTR